MYYIGSVHIGVVPATSIAWRSGGPGACPMDATPRQSETPIAPPTGTYTAGFSFQKTACPFYCSALRCKIQWYRSTQWLFAGSLFNHA